MKQLKKVVALKMNTKKISACIPPLEMMTNVPFDL